MNLRQQTGVNANGDDAARTGKMKADALIVVDVQNGFINQYTEHLIDRIKPLFESYTHKIACRFYNPPQSSFRSLMKWPLFDQGDDNYQLALELPESGFIYDKPEYTAATKTLLDFLEKNEIKTVDVCGINTEVCVLFTATDLFFKGYDVRALSDFSASCRGQAYHEAGILALKHCIGDKRVI
jgi:nicotinamidase-related amidase